MSMMTNGNGTSKTDEEHAVEREHIAQRTGAFSASQPKPPPVSAIEPLPMSREMIDAVDSSVPVSGTEDDEELYEEVNHPRHYNAHPAGIECVDVIEEMPHNVGQAVKYLWRAGLKPGQDVLKDLAKAGWWVSREIERIKKRRAAAETDDEIDNGAND